IVELVGVRPDPAVLSLFKRESERLERFVGAEPDVFVGADVDVDLEVVAKGFAEFAIGAVAGDDEVVIRKQRRLDLDLSAKFQPHPKLAGAILQNVQESLSADADEAMTRRSDGLTMNVDVDVVPMREAGFDLRGAVGIIGAEIVHGLVGEDDAPAE